MTHDSTSIDEAVMERTEQAFVVPVSCGWDDIGAWVALERPLERLLERLLERGSRVPVVAKDEVEAAKAVLSDEGLG